MKHSMTLGARLALAFALLVLLTALVGGFGLNRLAAVSAGTDDIAGHWLPKIKVLGDLRTLSNRMRRTEAEHLLALDAAAIAAAEQRLAAYHRELTTTQAEYALLIRSDEERALYAAAREQEDRYFAVQQRLLELSRNGEAASRETRMLFSGESKAAFNAMVAAMAQLVELNARGSTAADEAAHQVYRSASAVMLALVLGAVLASVWLAALLLRSVRRTLGADPAVAARLVEQVARGELDVKIRLAPGDTSSLMASLQSMQNRLGAIVQQVRINAESVATASTQIAHGNLDLSSRTERQASALQQTAASMEELGATVKQNAGHARQATHVAQAACSVAAEGGIVVEAVVETMKAIEESSRRVGNIVAVIDAIALQTNLLALNAAVEAARAGAQGSGFAVVAGEVRSLARRSAEAAQEIKALITVSTDRVARGTEQASLAGEKMANVVGSIAGVSDLMEQISRASQEQHQGVDQIGAAVSQMDHATQQNAALVEQSAAAAASLRTQAAALVETMAVFRVRGSDEPVTLPLR